VPDFAAEIRPLLDEAGWRASDLARALPVTKAAISSWFSGKRSCTLPDVLEMGKAVLNTAIQVNSLGNQDLADWISTQMYRKGWGPTSLGHKLGVDRSTVTRWANGRLRPKPHHLKLVIAALLGGDDRMAIPPIRIAESCSICKARHGCRGLLDDLKGLKCEAWTEEELYLASCQGVNLVWWKDEDD
jgi:transcriptional regulator with XRE-family HTH domain